MYTDNINKDAIATESEPEIQESPFLVQKVQTLISMIDQLDPSNKSSAPKRDSWAIDPNKTKEEFRNYDDNPRKAAVEAFYKEQHEKTTYDFVLKQRANYLKFDKCVMTMYVYLHHCTQSRDHTNTTHRWDMLHYLANIVDESDPDTDLSQVNYSFIHYKFTKKNFTQLHLVRACTPNCRICA